MLCSHHSVWAEVHWISPWFSLLHVFEVLPILIPVASSILWSCAWTACKRKQRRIQADVISCFPINLFLSRVPQNKWGTLNFQRGKHIFNANIAAGLLHLGHLDNVCWHSECIHDCLVISIAILNPLGSTQGRNSCLKLILFKASSGVPSKIRMMSVSLESMKRQLWRSAQDLSSALAFIHYVAIPSEGLQVFCRKYTQMEIVWKREQRCCL